MRGLPRARGGTSRLLLDELSQPPHPLDPPALEAPADPLGDDRPLTIWPSRTVQAT